MPRLGIIRGEQLAKTSRIVSPFLSSNFMSTWPFTTPRPPVIFRLIWPSTATPPPSCRADLWTICTSAAGKTTIANPSDGNVLVDAQAIKGKQPIIAKIVTGNVFINFIGLSINY